MTVKLIAVLECDSCGVTRGHHEFTNVTSASHELRRSAANLRGWTVFGSDNQYDECDECSADPKRTQQIREPLP
jgi:hypothetical protein